MAGREEEHYTGKKVFLGDDNLVIRKDSNDVVEAFGKSIHDTRRGSIETVNTAMNTKLWMNGEGGGRIIKKEVEGAAEDGTSGWSVREIGRAHV